MFVTIVIKCHSLIIVLDVFVMTPWHKPIHHNLS